MISSDYCRSVEGDLRNMFIVIGTSVIPAGGYLKNEAKVWKCLKQLPFNHAFCCRCKSYIS